METVPKRVLWCPEYYSKHSSTQFGHASNLLQNYSFRGDEAILDIGCGDGKITATLANLVPEGRVIGVDSDAAALEFARKTFHTGTYKNLTFIQGDATELDKLGDFDLIVSFSCLHYVQDQQAALTKIKNNLKKDGNIILMLYRKCKAQWSALDKTSMDLRWQHYFENYDAGYYEYLPNSYQDMLNNVELDRFKAIFTPEETISYENVEKFTNFITGWLPHLNILPQQHHSEFLDLFKTEYFNNLNIPQHGIINIPFMRLVVT